LGGEQIDGDECICDNRENDGCEDTFDSHYTFTQFLCGEQRAWIAVLV
jgi:hypothetical protein